MFIRTNNLGFPRIGANRELKKSLEAFWSGKVKEPQLLTTALRVRKENWLAQKNAGIDFIPSNDFSLYDQVLDMCVMLGAIPNRYQSLKGLRQYFAMARGLQDKNASIDVPAMEMTKWFDTNYHYIVPELKAKQDFKLNSIKILAEVKEARELGIETRPVVIGPISFLLLSKLSGEQHQVVSVLDLLDSLLPCYEELFSLLQKEGVSWVQIDEPYLVLELEKHATEAYRNAFSKIKSWKDRPKTFVATYFGVLKENMRLVTDFGSDALHVDLVRAPEELEPILSILKPETSLSLGLISGRNIWRTDLDTAHASVRKAVQKLGADRVFVGPSCSLLHAPVDLKHETKLDAEIKSWLSFAIQKLTEIKALADTANDDKATGSLIEESRIAIAARQNSPRIHNKQVKNRLANITPDMMKRSLPHEERAKLQRERLRLPDYPTTTIGSFPQTNEVRKARADWRAGKITEAEYNEFLKKETKLCIEKQEALDLDVLVHGEFERADMVEYFGERLSGFAFTVNGWVQSYGSRCVKPPIIYGDIERSEPMTVEWSVYAQSLTQKPMKGMLTGPVTILEWSFVRDDQPKNETCMEIALALRDEVHDLEDAGISVIQVDEPALREGLPLRHAEWKTYLRWAVDAFKLSTSNVRDDTQIHTHMCYSEFGDILASVSEMDADVLAIEASRSHMELLDDFATFNYPNEIGPGVYDIHSPRVPSKEEIIKLLDRARKVISMKNLWVNPDCGLKTRDWSEVESALRNMVAAAQMMRENKSTLQNKHP